jgi:hypothetical protein
MSAIREELLATLRKQPWIDESALSIETDAEGRSSLTGEVTVTDLEGVEILVYLISDVVTLCRERNDPGLIGARLHAEVLPASTEGELFAFHLWTDPLPPASFDHLAAVILEAIDLTEEESAADRNGGFIPLDEV